MTKHSVKHQIMMIDFDEVSMQTLLENLVIYLSIFENKPLDKEIVFNPAICMALRLASLKEKELLSRAIYFIVVQKANCTPQHQIDSLRYLMQIFPTETQNLIEDSINQVLENLTT